MWVFPLYPYSLIVVSILIPLSLKLLIPKQIGFKLAFINFLVMYLLIVGSANIYDLYIDKTVLSFDLNGDGVISEAEITNDLQFYWDKKFNDTGRNFAFITGFLYSIVHSILCYLGLRFFNQRGHPLGSGR